MSRCDSRVQGIAEAEQLGVSSEQAGRLRRNGPSRLLVARVLTIDNLVDQLELAEASGVFQCWNVNYEPPAAVEETPAWLGAWNKKLCLASR